MTKEEALALLVNAPKDKKKKSNINPYLSQYQVVKHVKNVIRKLESYEVLNNLHEKRVRRAVKDKKLSL